MTCGIADRASRKHASRTDNSAALLVGEERDAVPQRLHEQRDRCARVEVGRPAQGVEVVAVGRSKGLQVVCLECGGEGGLCVGGGGLRVGGSGCYSGWG